MSMTTETKPNVKEIEPMTETSAAVVRRVALDIAGGDPKAEDHALRLAYEAFIAGIAGCGYRYAYEGKAAARAILGLPPKED
jgi:hypothetical protein